MLGASEGSLLGMTEGKIEDVVLGILEGILPCKSYGIMLRISERFSLVISEGKLVG